MVEATVVEQDADARVGYLLDKGAAGPGHKLGVGLARNHQAHIHPREGGRAEGKEDGLGRQEVGGLDIDILPRAMDDADEALLDLRPGSP